AGGHRSPGRRQGPGAVARPPPAHAQAPGGRPPPGRPAQGAFAGPEPPARARPLAPDGRAARPPGRRLEGDDPLQPLAGAGPLAPCAVRYRRACRARYRRWVPSTRARPPPRRAIPAGSWNSPGPVNGRASPPPPPGAVAPPTLAYGKSSQATPSSSAAGLWGADGSVSG